MHGDAWGHMGERIMLPPWMTACPLPMRRDPCTKPTSPPSFPQVCDTVSEVACEVFEEPGWPELVPFLFGCIGSAQPGLMESALVVFAALASYVSDALKPQLPALVQVLTACLSHATRDVQIAALRAISNFIQVRGRYVFCAPAGRRAGRDSAERQGPTSLFIPL